MSLRIEDLEVARPVVGDTVTIYCENLVDRNGRPYDLSGASKIYCMVKSAPGDLDNAALININSSSNASQFVLTNAAYGDIEVSLSPTNSATLTANTKNYLGIKAIWASGKIEHIVQEEEFVLLNRIPLATS